MRGGHGRKSTNDEKEEKSAFQTFVANFLEANENLFVPYHKNQPFIQ
jgi:hypothetical protein